MPVILFHAGVETFRGGFVGVDVFFVISGYLITGIISKELDAGSFSIVDFYERRARRILPALFLMMSCCIPFAWIWMQPQEFKDFSKALVAVPLFLSNVLFWRESGYFAPDAELNPLLHTWSLAVEEQFYLLFPLLLWLIWRFAKSKALWVFLAIGICSMVLCERGWRNAPSANFYLAPPRAWELLVGACCALLPIQRSPVLDNVLSAAGLFAVAASVLVFSDATPFPSLYALLPVVGTAFVLHFGRDWTVIGRALGARALVGVGVLSYGAYLWHQPLFAFARLTSPLDPPQTMMLALAIGALVLAYLSWRFVEVPLRRPQRGPFGRRKVVFVFAALTAAAFVGFGMAGYIGDGYANRTSPAGVSFAELNLDERLAVNHGLSNQCEGKFTESDSCSYGRAPTILLWGDSFAMHLAPAMIASASKRAFRQMTKSSCAPIIGMSIRSSDGSISAAIDCRQFNQSVMSWLQKNKDIDTVILASIWNMLDGGKILWEEEDTFGASSDESRVLQALKQTVGLIRAQGRKVVIVARPPSTGADLGRCLRVTMLFGGGRRDCDFSLGDISVSASRSLALTDEAERFVPVVRMSEFVCPSGVCQASRHDIMIFRDAGHLSKEGGAWLGRHYDLLGRLLAAAR